MFALISADVLEAFGPEDCAEVMKDVDTEKVDGENRKFNDWSMHTIFCAHTYECILWGPIHQHTLHSPQNRRRLHDIDEGPLQLETIYIQALCGAGGCP